jgi:hypothetical protein
MISGHLDIEFSPYGKVAMPMEPKPEYESQDKQQSSGDD